jgi:hypothetical protein
MRRAGQRNGLLLHEAAKCHDRVGTAQLMVQFINAGVTNGGQTAHFKFTYE